MTIFPYEKFDRLIHGCAEKGSVDITLGTFTEVTFRDKLLHTTIGVVI